MYKNLIFVFGTGFLVGSSLMSIINHKQTIYSFKKLYNQLTIHNITSFCGTIWMGTLAYKFCYNEFDHLLK